MDLIRTFHPIGQGAFYTERHFCGKEEFTIVYDCGSTTLSKQELEKKIKSTFSKDYPIDILFISHFHADHINGIEILMNHCSIKRVVLPLLEQDAKTLIKVTNWIDDKNYTDTRLIDDPKDFFGEIPIITIKDINIDTQNQDENGINLEITTDISITKETQMDSGTVFTFPNSHWLFIPFNYKFDERKEQFLKVLNLYGLKLADIDTISKIKRNKTKIIEAYKTFGDLNSNSMAIFSGKQESDHINYYRFNCCCFNSLFYFFIQESGCLYLGDIDLTKKNLVTNMSKKLIKVIPFIGILQIPHHGSLYNFNKSIIFHNIRCAIFSYGTTNTYGHPSDRVIEDVIAQDVYPCFVTEQQNSIVIQIK